MLQCKATKHSRQASEYYIQLCDAKQHLGIRWFHNFDRAGFLKSDFITNNGRNACDALSELPAPFLTIEAHLPPYSVFSNLHEL